MSSYTPIKFDSALFVRRGAQLCRSCHTKNFASVPCLLLPSGSNNSVTACGLFSPLDDKFYHLELPELGGGKLFPGSSHGWVVTGGDSTSLRLLNPLTRAQLELPPRSCFPDIETYRPSETDNEYGLRGCLGKAYTFRTKHVRNHFTHKIILSTSPANDNYVAVAAYGVFDRLAYCRKGYTE